MNIYDYFNSRDVAEHCQRIGHKFNALESAVMINRSSSRTLAEKHTAYRAIIAEYPDMEIEHRLPDYRAKSLHKVLETIIAYEEKVLEAFLMPESNAVYQAEICYKNDCNNWKRDLFSNYEKSLEDALVGVDDTFERKPTPVFDYIRVFKRYIDSENYIYANVSRNGEIIEVCSIGIDTLTPPDETSVLQRYIDVPVPFKNGDLLEIDSGYWMGDIGVLKNLCRDDAGHHSERLAGGDAMDMTAYMFYLHDGSVRCECMHFYPDLRYCKRELEGEARILKYISLHLQDKLCLCSLLEIQKYLLAEKIGSDIKESHDIVDGLKRLGDDLFGL